MKLSLSRHVDVHKMLRNVPEYHGTNCSSPNLHMKSLLMLEDVLGTVNRVCNILVLSLSINGQCGQFCDRMVTICEINKV